jgi:hypothetical protein
MIETLLATEHTENTEENTADFLAGMHQPASNNLTREPHLCVLCG